VSYAQARLSAFPTQALRGYPTQALRGYPTQALRGLGAIDQASIAPLQAAFLQSLDDFITTARDQTNQIVQEATSGLTRQALNLFIDVSQPARDWANNIVNYATSVRDSLTRITRTGQPFYLSFPDDAKKILETAKKDLAAMVGELRDEARANSISGIFEQAINRVLQFLFQLVQILVRGAASAAAEFPLGAAAVAVTALTAAVVWYKFFRR
jgi:hypothetical protein